MQSKSDTSKLQVTARRKFRSPVSQSKAWLPGWQGEQNLGLL